MKKNVKEITLDEGNVLSRRKLLSTGAALTAASAVGATSMGLWPEAALAGQFVGTVIGTAEIKVTDATFTTVPNTASLPSPFTIEGRIAEVNKIPAASGGTFEC